MQESRSTSPMESKTKGVVTESWHAILMTSCSSKETESERWISSESLRYIRLSGTTSISFLIGGSRRSASMSRA